MNILAIIYFTENFSKGYHEIRLGYNDYIYAQ